MIGNICSHFANGGDRPAPGTRLLRAWDRRIVMRPPVAGIEHLGLERGHRTLTVTRKGGKVVTIPLAPRTARAIDLAIGERTEGSARRSPRAGRTPWSRSGASATVMRSKRRGAAAPPEGG